MRGTVAAIHRQFKHLFERVVDFVVGPCYKSYMRSIEHAFDQEGTGPMSSPTTQSSPTAQSSPVRLTRRGRIVLTLLMMAGLVLAGFTLGRGSSQAADRAHHARHTVTVQAGDTLWSVAERVAPHHDTRAVIAQIESLNDLPSAVVVPGEQLVVPTAG
jgi:hypothetical protein